MFRATPQWFIGMEREDFRENCLQAIKEVEWFPNWGEERIEAKQLDRDLEHRDAYGLRDTFAAFLDLNRETMMRASDAARLAAGQEAITP